MSVIVANGKDEKHIQDCCTPVGSFEMIEEYCSKIRALIDFIKVLNGYNISYR